jgi:hypothetical protein
MLVEPGREFVIFGLVSLQRSLARFWLGKLTAFAHAPQSNQRLV